jgi:hypothetical protein
MFGSTVCLHGRMASGGHGRPQVSHGPLCPTLLRPEDGPPLKQPYGYFRGGLPASQAACGHPLPLWTLHAVRLWCPRLFPLKWRSPANKVLEISVCLDVFFQLRNSHLVHSALCTRLSQYLDLIDFVTLRFHPFHPYPRALNPVGAWSPLGRLVESLTPTHRVATDCTMTNYGQTINCTNCFFGR